MRAAVSVRRPADDHGVVVTLDGRCGVRMNIADPSPYAVSLQERVAVGDELRVALATVDLVAEPRKVEHLSSATGRENKCSAVRWENASTSSRSHMNHPHRFWASAA